VTAASAPRPGWIRCDTISPESASPVTPTRRRPLAPPGTGELTLEERQTAANDIWPCADHARLIDAGGGSAIHRRPCAAGGSSTKHSCCTDARVGPSVLDSHRDQCDKAPGRSGEPYALSRLNVITGLSSLIVRNDQPRRSNSWTAASTGTGNINEGHERNPYPSPYKAGELGTRSPVAPDGDALLARTDWRAHCDIESGCMKH
jgi:hypothetical protein